MKCLDFLIKVYSLGILVFAIKIAFEKLNSKNAVITFLLILCIIRVLSPMALELFNGARSILLI